jgi:hypothetical protein
MSEREERAARLKAVAEEMDKIVREIGPKWIRLAHLSKEAKAIIAEIGNAPPSE